MALASNTRLIFVSPDRWRYKVAVILNEQYCLLGHSTVLDARETNFVGCKVIEISRLNHEVTELERVETKDMLDVDYLPVKELNAIIDDIIQIIKDV